MMKKAISFIGMLVILLALTVPVKAVPVTLDLATLDTFTQLTSTAPSFTFTLPSSFTGNDFTGFTSFIFGLGPNSVDVGIENQNLDWSAFTSLDLVIANNNENNWNFQLFVQDGSGVSASSAISSLPPDGIFNLFSVPLGSLDTSDIDDIFIRVSAILPINGNDFTAEYAVAPAVPEPSTLLLLGSGLAGLGLWRRMRKDRV